jgi:hypothetical protein
MAGKQAKILSDEQTSSLLVFASSTRNPRRNHLILLLSLKAGLRAGEIANLTWDMVVGPAGEIGSVIELRDCAAKKNSGGPPGSSTRRAGRCGTCNCSPVTGRSKPPSGTSTATPTPSASWWR